MGDFDINMFYGRAFDQCVACSKFILEEYINHKEDLMLGVMNDPLYIPKKTGMDKIIEDMENNMDGIIQIMDDDENDMIIIGAEKESK